MNHSRKALPVAGLLLLMFTWVGEVGAVLLNFDDDANSNPITLSPGQSVPAISYVAGFGISITGATTEVVIRNDPNVIATSGDNVLTQSGGNTHPVSFTLKFSSPFDTVTFSRAQTINGAQHPSWAATALDANGAVLSQVGEGFTVDSGPVPYTLTGPGIASVQFDSNNGGVAAFTAVQIDDLALHLPDCTVSIEPWRQSDIVDGHDHWGWEIYGLHDPSEFSDCPLSEYTPRIRCLGCALTSLAIVLDNAGVKQIQSASGPVRLDPGTLNDFMKNSTLQDYNPSSDVNFETATLDVSFTQPPPNPTNPLKGLRFSNPFPNSHSPHDLRNAVCTGNNGRGVPVIVQVNGVGHYVVVTGVKENQNGSGDEFTILDPGHRDKTSLDAYNNIFTIRGFVKDPDDSSALNVTVGDNADVWMIDSGGRRTGVDATTGQVVFDIPQSSYARDALDSDETGERVTGTTHSVHIFEPSGGTYQVTVAGLKLGPYTVSVQGFSQDGSPQPKVLIQGDAVPGLTSSFFVQYANTIGSAIDLAGSFDGGGQRPRDVNKFLTYSNPTASQTSLPAGTTMFPLQIVYGKTIIPSTFKAVLNGLDISSTFSPGSASGQIVNLNLQRGRNVLDFSVNGNLPTRIATDKDRLVFVVP